MNIDRLIRTLQETGTLAQGVASGRESPAILATSAERLQRYRQAPHILRRCQTCRALPGELCDPPVDRGAHAIRYTKGLILRDQLANIQHLAQVTLEAQDKRAFAFEVVHLTEKLVKSLVQSRVD